MRNLINFLFGDYRIVHRPNDAKPFHVQESVGPGMWVDRYFCVTMEEARGEIEALRAEDAKRKRRRKIVGVWYQ